MKNWSRLAGMIGATVFGATLASADCFEYRTDSYGPEYLIRHITQKSPEVFEETYTGQVIRHSVWIGRNDFIVARAVALSQPLLFVTAPNAGNVLSQSRPAGANQAYLFSEVHYSGNQAHQIGDGWVDVMVSFPTSPVPYQLKIYPLERDMRYAPDECDAKFIELQFSYQCDTGCGRVTPPIEPYTPCGGSCGDGMCCETDPVAGGDICLPGAAKPDGTCF